MCWICLLSLLESSIWQNDQVAQNSVLTKNDRNNYKFRQQFMTHEWNFGSQINDLDFYLFAEVMSSNWLNNYPLGKRKMATECLKTRDIDTAGKILVGPLLIPSRIDSCSCYYWLEIQTLWVSYLNPVIFVEVWSCYTSFIKWFHGLKQQAMRRFPRYSLLFSSASAVAIRESFWTPGTVCLAVAHKPRKKPISCRPWSHSFLWPSSGHRHSHFSLPWNHG